MKENLTYVAIILDSSSSMAAVKEATIAGFNAFLEEQRNAPGEVLLSLVTFADQVKTVYDGVPLARLEPLNHITYQPYGSTALHDAIGSTIDKIGRKLAALPESERPAKVLVMIQTDGEENASRWYYFSWQIKNMIDHQRTKYSWDFAFIGATEESVAGAIAVLGVPQNFTTSYKPTTAGTATMLRSASAGVANYRSADRDVYAVQSFFDPPATDE